MEALEVLESMGSVVSYFFSGVAKAVAERSEKS